MPIIRKNPLLLYIEVKPGYVPCGASKPCMRHTDKSSPLGLASAHTQEVRHTCAESAPLGLALAHTHSRRAVFLSKLSSFQLTPAAGTGRQHYRQYYSDIPYLRWLLLRCDAVVHSHHRASSRDLVVSSLSRCSPPIVAYT